MKLVKYGYTHNRQVLYYRFYTLSGEVDYDGAVKVVGPLFKQSNRKISDIVS